MWHQYKKHMDIIIGTDKTHMSHLNSLSFPSTSESEDGGGAERGAGWDVYEIQPVRRGNSSCIALCKHWIDRQFRPC